MIVTGKSSLVSWTFTKYNLLNFSCVIYIVRSFWSPAVPRLENYSQKNRKGRLPILVGTSSHFWAMLVLRAGTKVANIKASVGNCLKTSQTLVASWNMQTGGFKTNKPGLNTCRGAFGFASWLRENNLVYQRVVSTFCQKFTCYWRKRRGFATFAALRKLKVFWSWLMVSYSGSEQEKLY